MRRLILVGVVVTTLVGALGTGFLPYLMVRHPLLLLLTSADGRNLVLVASQLDLPVVLAVAVPRRVLAMLVTYGVGRLYGRAMLEWSQRKMPRLGKVATAFEGLFLRYSRLVLVLWPTYMSAALAGVSRTPIRAFLPFMVLGQVGYVVLSFYIGDSISGVTDTISAFFSKYLWQATVVFAGAVATQQLVSYWRRRRAADIAS